MVHNLLKISNLYSVAKLYNSPLFWTCLLSWITAFSLSAQHHPPVTIYEPNDYQASSQNWMFTQAFNSEIIVANNDGLLIFNGAQWTLFPSPTGTVIRSVKRIGDRIYSGSYREFGFWEVSENGIYVYTSLSEQANISELEDENFWNIIEDKDKVYFQSLQKIYIFTPGTDQIKTISSPNGISRLYKVGESLIYHSTGLGLFKIQNDQPKPYHTEDKIANANILNIFLTKEGLKILTKNNGFLIFRKEQFEKWSIPADKNLKELDLFSGIQLLNGDFALGSISNGLLIISESGKLKYQLNRSNGLSNNTILSIMEDQKNNLWLGLDNGINCINLASPFMEYRDSKGVLGTVYVSAIFQNKLYLGTNQGLFWKDINSLGEFSFVKNTGGQVWSLFSHDDKLFCGHDQGTFVVEEGQAERIASINGTWGMLEVPGKPDYIIQGNYTGLNVLQKNKGKWVYSRGIEGFSGSATQLLLYKSQFYINHGLEGLKRLEFDKDMRKVVKITPIKWALDPTHSSITTFNDELFYTSKDGLYFLDLARDSLVKSTTLSNFLEQNVSLPGKLVAEDKNRMWLFTDENIISFHLNQDSGLELSEIQVDRKLLKTRLGYENITYLGDGTHLMGLTDGYFYIDLKQLENLENNNDILINSVSVKTTGRKDSLVNLTSKGDFHSKENNLSFFYNLPGALKFQPVKYQYQLEGFHEDWSNWEEVSSCSFQNLDYGSYTFKVQAKVGKKVTPLIAEYDFTIHPPWYLSTLAILFYLFLFLITAIIINRIYREYYNRKQDKLIEKNQKDLEYLKLKNEQILTQVKNEQLTAKMDVKNKELAANTMNLIQKNEFLIKIRENLKLANQSSTNQKTAKVVSEINKELENEDTWELFKNMFDNVDKDFLKKVKEKHPVLTPNDLKLCTYLRLNLNSKEIAPLLNISVRSMEMKRYRLRKKMSLPHETNLVDYILSI